MEWQVKKPFNFLKKGERWEKGVQKLYWKLSSGAVACEGNVRLKHGSDCCGLGSKAQIGSRVHSHISLELRQWKRDCTFYQALFI